MASIRFPRCPTPSGLPRRLRRDEKGATAVEFGLIALPFFAMMFAIFETALTFWSTQVLETAVANASRKLYTGEFQTDPSNATQTPTQLAAVFKASVCSNVRAVFDCNGMVSIDVRTFSAFSSATVSPPVTSGAYDTSSYGFQSPGAKQITVVRASMQYPRYTSLPGIGGTLSNGKRLIMASSTFRTEPYQ